MTASSLQRAAFGDLNHELATTRRVLERVPDEHLDWRPHAKSFSLGELATHLVNLLYWQITTLQRDEFDLAEVPTSASQPVGRDELLRRWDERSAALREAMAQADDAALGAMWTLKKEGAVVLKQPRAAIVRGLGINHIVHHRGQLSVYLRLLDVPLPPMYGPTADEGR